MITDPNAYWERLELVIFFSGMSANALAKFLDLERGENLYQIKRKNNRISFDLAARIEKCFPEFSAAWLLTGDPRCAPVIEPFELRSLDDLYYILHNRTSLIQKRKD